MKKWIEDKFGDSAIFLINFLGGSFALLPIVLRLVNGTSHFTYLSFDALLIIAILWPTIYFVYHWLFLFPPIHLLLWGSSYIILFNQPQTIFSYIYYVLNLALIVYYNDVLIEYFNATHEDSRFFQKISIYKLEAFSRGLTFVAFSFAVIFPLNAITEGETLGVFLFFAFVAVVIGILIFIYELCLYDVIEFIKRHSFAFVYIPILIVILLIAALIRPSENDNNKRTNYQPRATFPLVTMPDLPESIYIPEDLIP